MKDGVIIIGGGELTLPAYHIARNDLGLEIVAFDFSPSAPGMRYADEAVVVSTKDIAGAVVAARAVSEKRKIRGVFTVGADVEVTVAAVAEALGLPGVSVEVARYCNDKRLTHQRLDLVGFIDKPRYALVFGPEDLRAATELTGFPCVVKPVDNCASRGVQRVDRPEDLAAAYRLAIGFNLDESAGVLVEECLLGTKHTVEMVVYKNRWHLLSIIDTHYISPRWPCETGLNTTELDLDDQAHLYAFATHVARAIGIDLGAHKVDVNRDECGNIKLIEITARLSGGFHCQCASPLAFGSNDIRAALKLAIGLPLDLEDIRHRHERGAAVRAVFPEPGRITGITGVADALDLPGVHQIFIWKQPGDMVGPYLNSADRCAFVIADGETTREAIANAERGVARVRIETVRA